VAAKIQTRGSKENENVERRGRIAKGTTADGD
jgi:hypothetical protein